MEFWGWIILILAISIFLVSLYSIKILLNQKHKYYMLVRRTIPNIILIIIIVYGIVSIIRYYEYMMSADATFIKLLTHNMTYTTIVNFIALLTFYQLLDDRVKNLQLQNEVENLVEVTAKKRNVVTYTKYEKIVERKERKVYKSYTKE